MVSQLVNCPLPLDFLSILCHTTYMTYTREQLITALQQEYEYLIHDDFDAENDLTADQHLEWLRTLAVEELTTLTSTDDIFTVDEFIANYG